jgi:protein-tyrosine phosphatase
MLARKVAMQEIDYFDKNLSMDKSNLDNLRRFPPPRAHERIKLFMDFSKNFDDDEVPDPYYGLGHGIDLVLDMIEDAAQGLIDELKPKFDRP